MADLGLAEAFQTLPDRQTRRAFFTRILPTLSDQDWRDLQLALCERRFQFDIVGNLPVELFVAVLTNLCAVEIFRLQGVCKRWNRLLNDATVLRLLLPAEVMSRYAPIYGETSLNDVSVLRRRFARRRAFQTCHPSWQSRLRSRIPHGREMSLWDDDNVLKSPVFCEGMVAAIVSFSSPTFSDEEVIELRNLYTGKQQTFRSTGRERIAYVTLTSHICGWATFKRCVPLR